MRHLLTGAGAALFAVTLAGCQTAGRGPDDGLAPIPGAYTEAQARRACGAEFGAGRRRVARESLEICMRNRMFGPSTDRWD